MYVAKTWVICYNIKMNKVFYFIDENPSDCKEDLSFFCLDRINYLQTISNVKRRKQSYTVWRLLIKAFNILGLDFLLEKIVFGSKENLWCVNDNNNLIYISLSHSENVYAVGISDESRIGIDVEKVGDRIVKLENKICKNDFYFCDKAKLLTKKWTEKESSYKLGSDNCNFFSTEIIDFFNNIYVLTLATKSSDFEFISVNCLY